MNLKNLMMWGVIVFSSGAVSTISKPKKLSVSQEKVPFSNF